MYDIRIEDCSNSEQVRDLITRMFEVRLKIENIKNVKKHVSGIENEEKKQLVLKQIGASITNINDSIAPTAEELEFLENYKKTKPLKYKIWEKYVAAIPSTLVFFLLM